MEVASTGRAKRSIKAKNVKIVFKGLYFFLRITFPIFFTRSNHLRVDILTFFSVTDPNLLELAEFGGVYAIPNQISKA